jgi:solute carrier family 39 (zinc transporter), member 1/2/3
MTVFVMFFVELMVMRYTVFDQPHSHGLTTDEEIEPKEGNSEDQITGPNGHLHGEDHLGHAREHTDLENANRGTFDFESYSAQMTAIFILEFGIIFHSIFVGLTLAVAGEEFRVLYIVIVFHQTFEGLGLGSRLASIEWPATKRWTPYILGAAYSLSTPVSIAIGLGVRSTYSPGSQVALIVNGVFDSISAGILIYTGLVELMAHEFMFSPSMRREKNGTVFFALGCMVLGAGKHKFNPYPICLVFVFFFFFFFFFFFVLFFCFFFFFYFKNIDRFNGITWKMGIDWFFFMVVFDNLH